MLPVSFGAFPVQMPVYSFASVDTVQPYAQTFQPSQVTQHNPYSHSVRVPSNSPTRQWKTPEYAAGYSQFPAAAANTGYQQTVSVQEVLSLAGTLEELSRTPNGSSFIQCALRESSDPANLDVIWTELKPHFFDLLLDAHGCYVIKSILERLPIEELQYLICVLAQDEQLCFSLCTHSLHTRRLAQFILEREPTAMGDMLIRRCREIGMTQQGCIVMQKAMDISPPHLQVPLIEAIIGNFADFAMDPFANYIVQHLLEVGNHEENSFRILSEMHGRIAELSCNKFASNVVEKCLFHFTADAQHQLITQMYQVDEELLLQMLQDSFGNYIIQSSIALASFRDIWMISEKLRNVLQRTPYGHKIEARLERRLKGKPVNSRNGVQHQYGNNGNVRGRKPFRNQNLYTHEAAPKQEPW
jgi:hypothetical protein